MFASHIPYLWSSARTVLRVSELADMLALVAMNTRDICVFCDCDVRGHVSTNWVCVSLPAIMDAAAGIAHAHCPLPYVHLCNQTRRVSLETTQCYHGR